VQNKQLQTCVRARRRLLDSESWDEIAGHHSTLAGALTSVESACWEQVV
jgi:hypothetical protein